jgi:hypothetical protein
LKLKRIWKKKEIEGCTEERHWQHTKDGNFSVCIELNYRLEGFMTYKRVFEWGKYWVGIYDKDDNEVHRIEKYLHTGQDGLDIIKEAKLWVQETHY